jgi:hypothetical protein
MDREPILKKTLVTVGTMVGVWVAFVGTVSLIAVLVTSHVVGSSAEASTGEGSTTASPPAPAGRAQKIDPLHSGAQAQPNPNRRSRDSI